MATTANILTLLKFYSSKQKSPVIEFSDFSAYMKRYAQHHIDENADLVNYVGNCDDKIMEELTKLSRERLVAITRFGNGKEQIYVVPYFIEYCSNRIKEIENNPSIPYPNIADLSKNVPQEILTKKDAVDIMYSLMDKEQLNDRTLYAIQFNMKVPAILFPSNISIQMLVDCALLKVKELLRKEEVHDYFLKKISISNPGKELSVKNFFNKFAPHPDEALKAIKETGENYYYWSQFFHFVKQDYTKSKDLSIEDINILQTVAILEVVTSYYKSRTAQRIQKDTAFKNLDMLLRQPPYYHNMADIVKFKDPSGIALLGQYSEADLKKHLEDLTQKTVGNDLPELLIFKLSEEEGYFIFKEKVMPLMLRLCNDARTTIRNSLTQVWYKYLLEFDYLPEMKDPAAFERCLQRELDTADPILAALLNASFLPVVSYEEKTVHLTLYRDDMMVPLSELLMISRAEVLSDAKIKLPFWYSLPLVSWLMGMILGKTKKEKVKQHKQTATAKVHAEEVAAEEEKAKQIEHNDTSDPKLSRKKELRAAAAVAEKVFVPESSTLDRELAAYKREWNDRIGKENSDNLTEDINSLIRDYMRKVLRTLKAENFNAERISSLAQSLVDTPGMMKIKNHPALKRYTELYIVKLIKNIP